MHDSAPRFALSAPLASWSLLILLATYLLVGTTGHLPWRGDDLTHLGPIHAMLQGSEWLIPEIAGESYLGTGPLYYWIGALLAKALGGLLPVHDAARLASSIFTGLSLYWTGLAARRLHGSAAFAPAILLGMGSLGLVVHAHETQPMLAQLAGMALCYAGLGELSERPQRAGLQAGLGIGVTFLAGGLSGLGLTLPLVLIPPLLSPHCRTPRALGGLATTLGLSGLLIALWIMGVRATQPQLLPLWWNAEVLSMTPHSQHLTRISTLFQLLGWFAWPLWPIAGWALWRNRHSISTLQIALPVVASLLALLLVATTGGLRAASILPVLPPLTLLAALGAGSLRRGAANAFDWFGTMTFVFFAILVWLGWSALHFAWPPGLARQVARLAPDFQRTAMGMDVLLALLISSAIVILPMLTRRGALRSTTNWALGMTLLWCLAVTLWEPWFAHTKNYQPIAAELSRELSRQAPGCILRKGLGDTQRAALDYFANVRTQPFLSNSECRLLLAYASSGSIRNIPKEWQLIWERRLGGGRKAENFRLYRRD
ncbi:hypothetical protein [Zoogloea sp.]|uniref:ArnT family glycosyltransferase n=1 Tax=Zoogloea sp. TaxID=49181 RepID=UPI0026369699|nr:hypothetical protein [Zoogloea sp.]MDD3354803.1 hypothetical protein [Zoogloea sp.]